MEQKEDKNIENFLNEFIYVYGINYGKKYFITKSKFKTIKELIDFLKRASKEYGFEDFILYKNDAYCELSIPNSPLRKEKENFDKTDNAIYKLIDNLFELLKATLEQKEDKKDNRIDLKEITSLINMINKK